jgi:hypothetical protein
MAALSSSVFARAVDVKAESMRRGFALLPLVREETLDLRRQEGEAENRLRVPGGKWLVGPWDSQKPSARSTMDSA